MRTVLTRMAWLSLALSVWATGARAQEFDVQPAPPVFGAGNPAGPQSGATGVIPQPTPASPGIVTGVTLGELYTDNLSLAGSGQPKPQAFITQIEPFIKSAFHTPRISGIFDYSLTGYQYAGAAASHQLIQNLATQGTVVVVPDHLFIAGMANYGREAVNQALPYGPGTFFLDNNQLNVFTANVSPYWIQDVGDVGSLLVRYSHGRIVYGERGIQGDFPGLLSGLPNTSSNGVQFRFSGPANQLWDWNLDYVEQRLTPEYGVPVDFASATIGVTREIEPGVHALVNVGKETHFLPDGSYSKLGAGFWNAGIEWADPLNKLRLTAGHRYYGPSYDFSWTHAAALLSTTLSYIEKSTDISQQLLEQNPTDILLGLPNAGALYPSLIGQGVYVMKRATASADYTMPKGSLTASVYAESRDYIRLDAPREKIDDADLAWRYAMGPRTTLTPALGWQRFQFVGSGGTDTVYAQLSLAYQWSRKDFGSIRLRSQSSQAVDPVPGARNYRVDVLFVQWTRLL